jgi:hypothetical protein
VAARADRRQIRAVRIGLAFGPCVVPVYREA